MPFSDADLLRLFRDQESDLVERKESIADLNVIAQIICAFANDLPNHQQSGVVFIGQRDSGDCAGLNISDDLLVRLGGLRADGRILPFPVLSVQRKVLDGCAVAVVIVEPSDNPPVRFNGRCWIRVGPRRATATAEEERRLAAKRRWGALGFDAQPLAGVTLDDIDVRRFELEYLPSAVSADVLARDDRTIEDQLRALRLIGQNSVPTTTAVLMLGKEPCQWLPGAYTQFVRYQDAQIDPEAIVDQKEVTGSLIDQMLRVDDLFKANIRRSARIEGRTVTAPDYPIDALRQIYRNAVLHRSYDGSNAPVRINWFSDRIEIISPGGPFGQVTIENFGSPGVTDYRNPTLAAAMKEMGFVERFGAGLQIARRAMKDNENPEIEFSVDPAFVFAVLRPA
jgi:ATP-dependent DNA helicase RecG